MAGMESEPDTPAAPSKPPVSTLVFMDLETTGLPSSIGRKNVHITEISLVAVDRLDFEDDKSPLRVINKLSVCVQPRTAISYGAMKVTGLSNDILETQQIFNDAVPKLLDVFLSRLRRPICLLAHNGHCYDYPILQAELKRLNCSLPEDILCADTLEAFRKIGLVPPNDTVVVDTPCEVAETNNYSACKVDLTDDDIEKLLSEDMHLLENVNVPHEPHLMYNYNTQTQNFSTPNCFISPNNVNISDNHVSNSKNNAVEFGSGECTPIKTGIVPPVNGVYYANGNGVATTPQIDHLLSDNNQEHRDVSHAKRRLFSPAGNESTKKIVTESPSSSTVKSRAKKLPKKPQYSLEKLYIHYFGDMPPDSHHAESDCINLSKVCQKVSKHFLPWLDEHSYPFSSTSALW